MGEKQPPDLMSLAPELQIKIFEALPSPQAAASLRQTSRRLDAVFTTHRAQIEARIRDTLVAPFYTYYAFLGTLHLPNPDSAIRLPPPGGWPHITRDICAATGFGKTNFAADVLRHLPSVQDDRRQNTHNTDFRSSALDYSLSSPWSLPAREFLSDVTVQQGLMKVHEVAGPTGLAHTLVVARAQGTGGVELYLDTWTGVVHELLVNVRSGGGGGVSLPVREYFAYKTRQCRELRQVFVPGQDGYWGGLDAEEAPYDAAAMEEAGGGRPSHPDDVFRLEGDKGDLEWVRHLYRKFGWPGEGWRKEDCMKAIAEYVESRNGVEEDSDDGCMAGVYFD